MASHFCKKIDQTIVLKENFTLIIIFLNFALIDLEWDSITLYTNINFFSSKFFALKTFEFEPKTNIGNINSDDAEEGAEYKVMDK